MLEFSFCGVFALEEALTAQKSIPYFARSSSYFGRHSDVVALLCAACETRHSTVDSNVLKITLEIMTTPASQPPPLDPGHAGQVWRQHTLEDFDVKLKSLNLDDESCSEFVALRDRIASLTAELDDLYERQERTDDSTARKEWWHDGEYDADRADAWNDEGLAACRAPACCDMSPASSYGRAYECFTEAIRLNPQSAVYHNNRALAALKLGRYDLALEDAENAMARRDGYVAAYVRAGKASLGMGDGERARRYFAGALEVEPGCAAAVKGVREAERVEQARRARGKWNVEQGNACVRPRLAWSKTTAVENMEAVAMRLIAAEEMLRAVGPQRGFEVPGAMYEKAECLILLGRYAQAIDFINEMDTILGENLGETRYLRAEAAWRRGDLESALVLLKGMGHVVKCEEVAREVEGYLQEVTRIRGLLDDGMDSEAIATCDELMARDGVAGPVCSGLMILILRLRARGYCQQRRWVEAQEDLDACLGLNAEDTEAMRERADVLRERGLYTEYFLSLQGIKRVAPGMPGLASLIEGAARLASGEGRRGEVGRKGGGGGSADSVATGAISSFEVLGVARGATVGEVRRAYLRLAAQWHPDKWAGKPMADIQAADAKFKAIKDAYDDLRCD